MKMALTTSLVAVLLSFSIGAMAQDAHAAHHATPTATSQEVAMINGVVKRVDKAAGSVTIAHEPLTNLGMPAMTMTFLVKDRTWLDSMKVGAAIRFHAESVKGELTVVALDRPTK